MKQSEILHVSVCGSWLRLHGNFKPLRASVGYRRSQVICYKGCTWNDARYWQNGANHPARKLEYIEANSWLLLN